MQTEAQVQGLGEFACQGFTLEYPDDHLLFLMHEGERVAVFSQTGAAQESLQDECARHLVMEHGWDGCLDGEELQRLGRYANKLKTADGNLAVLSLDEKEDLLGLLRNCMVENGMTPPEG
jgi:hypothetical protein